MTKVESKECKTCGRVFNVVQDFLTGTSRWRMCQMENLWFNCGCGSTLMLKKGKFDWYSPDRFLDDEARGIFNQLGNLKDLPHLPTSIIELQQMMGDENVAAKKLAGSVKREPFIAASVLQVAENLRRTRKSETKTIESLEHAVVYIGRRALMDIVSTAAIRSFKIPEGDFDSDAFWEESFVTGAIAEALCRQFELTLNRDEVYLAGTLTNVGKLVTAICFPQLASKVNRDVKDRKLQTTWRAAEQSYKFPEHTILGEIAASMWGLPDFVADTARHHHDLPKMDGDDVTISQIVGFALQLTHWIQLQPHRIENELLEAYKSKFGLDDKQVDTLADKLFELRKEIRTKIEA